jgi:hypothetical protein
MYLLCQSSSRWLPYPAAMNTIPPPRPVAVGILDFSICFALWVLARLSCFHHTSRTRPHLGGASGRCSPPLEPENMLHDEMSENATRKHRMPF